MGMLIFKLVIGLFAVWQVYEWLREDWRNFFIGEFAFKQMPKAVILAAAYIVSFWYGQPYGWIAGAVESFVGFILFTVIGDLIEWLADGGLKDLATAFGQLTVWLWGFWYIQALCYISATLLTAWLYQGARRHKKHVADLKAENYRLTNELQRAKHNHAHLWRSYQEVVAGLEAVRRRMDGSKKSRPSRAVELLRIDAAAVLKAHPFDDHSKAAEDSCSYWNQVFQVREDQFLVSRGPQ